MKRAPSLLDGRLKVRHLVLVDALSARGSVAGAAASMHVTQPVVTRALQELESILGVALYHRTVRGVSPTVFGEVFVNYARDILRQLSGAARHVTELAAAQAGTVEVGIHLSGATTVLPRAIVRLKREHPLLTVVVHQGSSDALLIELTAGRFDVVVGGIADPCPEGLVRTSLYEEPMNYVVRSGHPALTAENQMLGSLLEYPWILPRQGSLLRTEIESQFDELGLDTPADLVESASFLTTRALLLNGNSIAVLPSFTVLDDPQLKVVLSSFASVEGVVGTTTVAGRPHGPATSALLEALRSAADSMVTELVMESTSTESKE